VVRHASDPGFYDILLAWLEDRLPDERRRFELRLLGERVRDWSPYVLHIPWLQDPVEDWSPRAYRQALRLGEGCAARGIPVINPVERLARAAKSNVARVAGDFGIRTPRIAPIKNRSEFRETLLGFDLPLFVREDRGHRGFLFRADTRAEAHAIPLGMLRHPVVVELIDAQNPSDGLYRKYRYAAIGDEGVPQHLHFSTHWVTRGRHSLRESRLTEEEVAYTRRPDPNHAVLQQVRRALGFDFVAFDYTYDPDERLVLWEGNPYPYLHRPGKRRLHRVALLERILAAMVNLYFERAGLPVSAKLSEFLRRDSPEGAGGSPG
jgi:hypothetical protein